jgi:hypothetical protein
VDTDEGSGALGPTLWVVALAIDLWLLALVLPMAHARAWELGPLLVVAPTLIVVGVGARSAPGLLLGVPLAALGPLALPELESARQARGPFLLVALVLGGYLYASLRLLARADVPSDMAQHRGLGAAGAPHIWRRRRRVYGGLAALAALLPALFIQAGALDGDVRAIVAGTHARPEAVHALLLCAGTLVSALAFAVALVRPLGQHLEVDQALPARRGRRFPLTRGERAMLLALAVAVAIAVGAALGWAQPGGAR